MITACFEKILAISVATSPLILAGILFAPLLNKKYAAKWEYLIWILLSARLLLPFRVALSIPAPAASVSEQTTVAADGAATVTTIAGAAAATTDAPLSASELFAVLWLTGCVLFLLVHLLSYRRFRRRLSDQGTHVTDASVLRQMQRLSKELNIRSSIQVIHYPQADSPMVTGLLKPVLVLPDEPYEAETLRFILRHELVHIKRHDVFFKWLFAAANAVHWFNPLVYIMRKEASVSLELSCDERVVQEACARVRKAYTDALFFAFDRQRQKKSVFTTPFYGGKKTMKRRFQNILSTSPKKNGAVLCAVAVCLALLSGMTVIYSESRKEATGAEATETEGSELAEQEVTEASAQETAWTAIAYLKDVSSDSLCLDRAEWIEVPGSRAEELGLTADDAPSGFFVYNPTQDLETYPLSSACTFTLLDWENSYAPIEVSAERFCQLIAERGEQNDAIPYTVCAENGEITSVEEHYVP